MFKIPVNPKTKNNIHSEKRPDSVILIDTAFDGSFTNEFKLDNHYINLIATNCFTKEYVMTTRPYWKILIETLEKDNISYEYNFGIFHYATWFY